MNSMRPAAALYRQDTVTAGCGTCRFVGMLHLDKVNTAQIVSQPSCVEPTASKLHTSRITGKTAGTTSLQVLLLKGSHPFLSLTKRLVCLTVS